MQKSKNIFYRVGGSKLRADFMVFSGGEVHIKLPETPEEQNPSAGSVVITAKLKSSTDVMELLMTTEALKNRYPNSDISLNMPYIPYARQDRRCEPNEAFSLKVFCTLINAQNYKSVTVWDAHSEVSVALLDRCKNISMADLIASWTTTFADGKVLVSPDAGAAKKVEQVAKAIGTDKIIYATKVRDTKTGQIVSTKLDCTDIAPITVLIVDDICDGGRTFIELAKKLKERGADRVELYVTHGIFSNGFYELKQYIDHIYTTSSVFNPLERQNPESFSNYVTVII